MFGSSFFLEDFQLKKSAPCLLILVFWWDNTNTGAMNMLRRLCTQTLRRLKKPSPSLSLFVVSACASRESTSNAPLLKPLQLLDPKEMTHGALIRQACALNASTNTQIVTQVLIAINEASNEYRNAMSELMVLLEESLLLASNSSPSALSGVEELIVQQRLAVEEQRGLLLELVSLMEYVEKMVTSAAETAFLAGAEHSSTLMCERLNSALSKVAEECAANRLTEEDLLRLQEIYVVKLSEIYSNELESNDNSGLTVTQEAQIIAESIFNIDESLVEENESHTETI